MTCFIGSTGETRFQKAYQNDCWTLYYDSYNCEYHLSSRDGLALNPNNTVFSEEDLVTDKGRDPQGYLDNICKSKFLCNKKCFDRQTKNKLRHDN